jgi:hypothetical protein
MGYILFCMLQEAKRKCSNLLTATAPDEGQQAETCSAEQNITHELQQVLKVWIY